MQNQLMTHIVAGYPDMKKCLDLGMLMAKSGVDFIEIQIPFSDPVADGPTIMAANQKALGNGTKVEDCFELMKKLSGACAKKSWQSKLLFMTYFNIIHHYGVEKFCKKAASCGCYGLIVPDMPIDEEKQEGYMASCKEYGLHAIQVVSPLTSDERLRKLAKHASGFVYCVSRFGTTGASGEFHKNLKNYLRRVKKYIKVPLAVGFGIAKKEQVKMVHEHAEIAVIGSKIVDLVDKGGIPAAGKFLKDISRTIPI